MLGIQAIGTYLPEVRINNMDRIAEFERDASFVHEKIGFYNLRRKPENYETSDMCVEAYKDLLKSCNLDPSEIDCLVVCTQNPDGHGLPHTSAIVHKKLELKDSVAAFDISLGCSGFVYGLNIVEAFMQANNFSKGLFFTADPYSKILDKMDRNTELLFGDGASCTLISNTPKVVSKKAVFSTHGKLGHTIQVRADTGILEMNGRAVFRFVFEEVPRQIRQCLTANDLKLEDIDLFIVHQGSRFIVDHLAEALKVSSEKLPFSAEEIGNTVSSTIPLSLKDVLQEYKFNKILISGFGVGLSTATNILQRV